MYSLYVLYTSSTCVCLCSCAACWTQLYNAMLINMGAYCKQHVTGCWHGIVRTSGVRFKPRLLLSWTRRTMRALLKIKPSLPFSLSAFLWFNKIQIFFLVRIHYMCWYIFVYIKKGTILYFLLYLQSFTSLMTYAWKQEHCSGRRKPQWGKYDPNSFKQC